MKKLFLADLAVLNEAKLAALIKQANGAEIVVPFGSVDYNDSKISVNTSLSNEQKELLGKLGITLLPYKEVKKAYSSFEERYIVRTSDELLSAFVFDMNLEGRDDIQVLNFEVPDFAAIANELRSQISILLEQNRALLGEVNDLKLRLSSVVAVLSEDQRKQAVMLFESQKKSIGDTMQKSAEFGKILQSLKEDASIQEVLQKLEETLAIEGLALAVSRNYFKLLGKEESEEEITAKQPVQALASNKALFQAVIASLAQG